MKQKTWFSLITAVFLVSILFSGTFGQIARIQAEEERPSNILILNSYSDSLWTESLNQGFFDVLRTFPKEYITYTENLDYKRFPEYKYQDKIIAGIANKYRDIKIDIILTTDDYALKFAIKNRQEMFSDAPIIFTGVHKSVADQFMKQNQQLTGVYEEVDAKTTLQYALNINPDLKKVYVISEQTETGSITEAMILTAIRNTAPQLEFDSLSDQSLEEILEIVSGLEKDSILLMGAFSVDKTKEHYGGHNLARLISEASTVPLYVLYNFEFGTGALGGNILMGEFQGALAGHMAVAVLNGTEISEITPMLQNSHQATFDYHVMEKYHIPLNKLPDNCVIVNREISFVERYQTLVLSVLGIITFLILMITILLINITRRIKAEKKLVDNNAQIRELYDTVSSSEEELQAQYDELLETKNHLSISEERYRLVAEASNDIIWDLNLITNRIYFPERFIRDLEFKDVEANMEWDKFLLLIHPEDKPYFILEFEGHVSGKSLNFETEVRMKVRDGSYHWFTVYAKVIKEGNKPVKVTGCFINVMEKKQNLKMIEDLAYFDTLTKMHNRTGFLQKVLDIHLEAVNSNGRYALFYIDFDNFKDLNDTFGHALGDEFLAQMALKLRNLCDEVSTIARLGGDEFIMILNGATDQKIDRRVEELLGVCSEKMLVNERIIYPSASIGIAIYPDHSNDYETLIRYADIAMYVAKREGKKRFKYFTNSLYYMLESKVTMSEDIRLAIDQSQFFVHYQPEINALNGKINYVEALIRWKHPERGMISPAEFIPLAEETGQIIEVGLFVLSEVLEFKKRMNALGWEHLAISVNVSIKQLVEEDFIDKFTNLVMQSGITTNQIIIEITESIFMQSFEETINKLNLLREQGFLLALDDFGTGYSSLSYLIRLPIDILKIDKSFIERISYEDTSKSLIVSIINIAHNLGLKVVAEGVEQEEEYKFLKEHGCDYIQGYYFSKPLCEEDLVVKQLKSGK